MKHMKYAVIIEKSDTGFGAYVPDLPGCVAVAESRKKAIGLIREAIQLHIQSMNEYGDKVPLPSSSVEIVEVAA